ncbi:hypothetical protein ES319_A06G096600v1 [Gossypium barbadense]|uniref:Retrotransposon gag domain-containing protein n=2 Tax=Gossypium TaxID=3633 RepID=A0A5J5VCE7_GOSBA|nr:hypothetical protein ES319_A06G096600v1 [Gossypium barbadense]
MNTLQQGMTVFAYYTKLKGIWDELNTYSQIPPCTCGSAKALAVGKEKEKVHQFPMGLNKKYKMTRSQILNMDPLPSLSRVYAQQLKGYNTNRKSTSSRYLSKLFGEHCKKSRHIKETCFKLHGYPEWCEKGKKSSKPKAANSAQHLEKDEGNTSTVLIVGLTNEQYAQLISMLNLEKSQTSTANFAGFTHEEADWNG